jgi:TetR/AcrR family transcriptional repressor of nem operon
MTGRPRTFDRDAVLDDALEVFWHQGYEATSVQDLVDAMGIHRASLYNTFGGKHALYLEALRRYEREWMEGLLGTLRDADDAPSAVRALLERVADEAASCPKQGSCLLTNAATERGHHDEDAAERIRANFQRIEDALCDVLERGRARGALPDAVKPRAQARSLLTTIQGLRVLARTSPLRDTLQDVVEQSMRALVCGASTPDASS